MRRCDPPDHPKTIHTRRAVGYARVSTSRQAQHELSLSEQQRKIEEFCTRGGIDLIDMFVDRGLSGRTNKRPQFKAMIDFMKERGNSITALVVYNSSRLFRNTAKCSMSSTN